MDLPGRFAGRRVVITGGSGFLGRALQRRLRAWGATVRAPGRRDCDLTRRADCQELFSGGPVDLVIHAAARSGGIAVMQRTGEVFFENLVMGLETMEAARKAAVGKFVAIGSSCEYPGYLEGDLPEEKLLDGPPHSSVQGLAHAKRAIYAQGIAYRTQWNFPVIHVILPTLYGPEDHFDQQNSHVATALIQRFVEARLTDVPEVVCWGTGRAVREFLYIEDAVDGILTAATAYDDTAPLNIGTGNPTTIRELASLVSGLAGYSGKIRWDASKPEGHLRKVLAVTRCRSLLDWSPRTPLREGLERTLAWYQAASSSA